MNKPLISTGSTMLFATKSIQSTRVYLDNPDHFNATFHALYNPRDFRNVIVSKSFGHPCGKATIQKVDYIQMQTVTNRSA